MPRKKDVTADAPKRVSGLKAHSAKRKRGRPARISREAIIQKSLEILDETSVEDFMIKTVAQELSTVSMAIYNYFGSREELLMAVADEVCLLFKPPRPKETWQETLLAWLWAIKKHADLFPVMLKIIGINGHTSSGWIKITAPVTLLLYERLGLRDKPLALATYLFVSTAATMIHLVSESSYRKAMPSTQLEGLDLDEQQLMVLKKTPLDKLKEKEILDTLFAQLLKGIEVFL